MIHVIRITYLDNFRRDCTKQAWQAPQENTAHLKVWSILTSLSWPKT